MKASLTFVSVLLLSLSSCLAQYEVYKSGNGVVLLSKRQAEFFTLDIPGDKIVPIGMDSAPHPYFTVDGRFLQVMPVLMDEFKGDQTASDETVLKQHLEYEAKYYEEPVSALHSEVRKLASGQTALFWSFVPKQTPKEQVFMSFRANGCVVVLGSAVDGDFTKASDQEFLGKIAASFHSSDQPITLKFFPDGHYERR